jgi:hypothetical protein
MAKFDLSWHDQESPEFREFAKGLNAPKLRSPSATSQTTDLGTPDPVAEDVTVAAKGGVGRGGDTRSKVTITKKIPFAAPKYAPGSSQPSQSSSSKAQAATDDDDDDC